MHDWTKLKVLPEDAEGVYRDETLTLCARINERIEALLSDREVLDRDRAAFLDADVEKLAAESIEAGQRLKVREVELLQHEMAIRADIERWLPMRNDDLLAAMGKLNEARLEARRIVEQRLRDAYGAPMPTDFHDVRAGLASMVKHHPDVRGGEGEFTRVQGEYHRRNDRDRDNSNAIVTVRARLEAIRESLAGAAA